MRTIPQEGVEHSEPQLTDSDGVSQQYHGLCSLENPGGKTFAPSSLMTRVGYVAISARQEMYGNRGSRFKTIMMIIEIILKISQ